MCWSKLARGKEEKFKVFVVISVMIFEIVRYNKRKCVLSG